MSSPVIGITCNSDNPAALGAVYVHYHNSVEIAGGRPRALLHSTVAEAQAAVQRALDGFDGLLLSGGDDLDPALYGQSRHPQAIPVNPARQAFEMALIAEAERRRLPIMGICLGCQIMNVHRGGSLTQFLPDVPRDGALEHRKINDVVLRHDVTVESDSLIGRTLGKPHLSVNTYHKQAIDRLGRGLRVVARATDGVIEAIEDTSGPLFIGLQWHPERISDEPEEKALFDLLVRTAAKTRAAAAY